LNLELGTKICRVSLGGRFDVEGKLSCRLRLLKRPFDLFLRIVLLLLVKLPQLDVLVLLFQVSLDNKFELWPFKVAPKLVLNLFFCKEGLLFSVKRRLTCNTAEGKKGF